MSIPTPPVTTRIHIITVRVVAKAGGCFVSGLLDTGFDVDVFFVIGMTGFCVGFAVEGTLVVVLGISVDFLGISVVFVEISVDFVGITVCTVGITVEFVGIESFFGTTSGTGVTEGFPVFFGGVVVI